MSLNSALGNSNLFHGSLSDPELLKSDGYPYKSSYYSLNIRHPFHFIYLTMKSSCYQVHPLGR